jgi:drug/metabolite transporter (DMT)-like permease
MSNGASHGKRPQNRAAGAQHGANPRTLGSGAQHGANPRTLGSGTNYIVVSAVAFSVMSVLVKLASADVPLGELVFFRGLVTLALSWLMVRRARLPTWGHNRKGLLGRGILGFCGLTCYYAALTHLPLAHATLIQNATPVVTAALAWWLLRERVTPTVAAAIVLGLVGVAVVNLWHDSQSVAADVPVFAIVIAMVGTVFSASAYVTVRELSKTEDPLLIVFYFPLVAAPLALPWALVHWVWPTAVQWLLLVAIGVATQMGQVCLTRGLALLPAGRATAIGYVQAIFAAMWGVALFHERIHAGIVVGMICIGAATLLVAAPRKITK